MPIIFDVALVCDAPGCASTQAGQALYEHLTAPGPTPPFALRYDLKSGLDWNVNNAGGVSCSKLCAEKLKS